MMQRRAASLASLLLGCTLLSDAPSRASARLGTMYYDDDYYHDDHPAQSCPSSGPWSKAQTLSDGRDTSNIIGVTWLSDKKVVSGVHYELEVWDAQSGEKTSTLKDANRMVTAVDAIDATHVVASYNAMPGVKVWDVDQEKMVANLDSGYVEDVAKIDDTYVVAGIRDGKAHVWNWKTGKKKAALHHDDGSGQVPVRVISVAVVGDTVVTGASDGTLKVFDGWRSKSRPAGKDAGWIPPQTGSKKVSSPISSLSAIDGSTFVAGSSKDSRVYVFNLKGERLARLKGHTDGIRGVSRVNDGLVASASDDGTVRVWDWKANAGLGSCIQSMSVPGGDWAYAVDAHNENIAVSAFGSGKAKPLVELWTKSKSAASNTTALP